MAATVSRRWCWAGHPVVRRVPGLALPGRGGRPLDGHRDAAAVADLPAVRLRTGSGRRRSVGTESCVDRCFEVRNQPMLVVAA